MHRKFWLSTVDSIETCEIVNGLLITEEKQLGRTKKRVWKEVKP